MCTEAWHGLEAIFKSPKPLVLPHCQHHFLECFHHLNLGNHGWQTWQHAKDGKRPRFPNPVKSSLDGLGEAEPYKSHFTAWHKLGNFLTFCSGNGQGSLKCWGFFFSYTAFPPPILEYAPSQHKRLSAFWAVESIQKCLCWCQGDSLCYILKWF